MDIYSILVSKTHNPHYLNRYVTFIQNCQKKNIDYKGPIEAHHICPRAKDMFPEYTNFKKYPWNKATLTPRQHFIAHLLLWKTFFTSASQTYAAWQMKHYNNMRINSHTYEVLKEEFRKLSSIMHKNKVVVKDASGNISKISNKDPRYLSGELVSLTAGNIGVKDSHGNTFRISVKDPRYLSGECIPISKGMTHKKQDTSNYKKPKSKSHIENIKKWVSVTDPNTMESKRILKTDPLYVSGYYKGLGFGKKRSNESKERSSQALKGKPHHRCSCTNCGAEISINNLDRHYKSKKCLDHSRH